MFFALLTNPSPTSTSDRAVSSPKPTPSAKVLVISRTPTPLPTPTLTPTPIPTPSVKPTPTPSSSFDSLFLDSVNSYRASKGLSAVSSDSYTCSFAKLRAQEISTNFNHDGFNNRLNSHTLPYPSNHEVTENIAMTSNPNDVINMWINSPGHSANMQKDTPFVCIQNSGDYYVYEGYKP